MDTQAELCKIYEEAVGSVADGLTGVYTHGIFQAFLAEECNRCNRYGEGFSLALIDVDFLGKLNAQKGPLKGDQALKKIAMILNSCKRSVDIAARYSGGLFAVLYPKTNAEEAFQASERIRATVDNHLNSSPTISIGIAAYPEHGLSKETLMTAAHQALKEAKLKGHNKTVVWEKEESRPSKESTRLLVVDDDERNLKLIESMLRIHQYEVVKAFSGEEALSALRQTEFDLILSDVMMPGMDGFELCRRIKQNSSTRLVPIIMLTALDDIASKVKAIESGADDFMNKPPNKMELFARIKSLVSLKRIHSKMTSIRNVVFSLANTVEAKDGYTQGHIERVSNLSVCIGRRIGLNESELDALKLGGALHDIGKIAVPDDILNKPGPLTAAEWEIMKKHTDIGFKICLPLKDNLGMALSVVRHHHEKLDGSGYPDALKGDQISMVARIMAVVDIYDALITDRPYRKGMSQENALRILEEEAQKGKLDASVIEHLKTFVSSSPAQPSLEDAPCVLGREDIKISDGGGGAELLRQIECGQRIPAAPVTLRQK
jgi:putative two-component system response regulator